MKLLRGFSSVVPLAVALSSASAAQTLAHGKFTLAHEVHWQSALIPSGDYEFFVKRSGGSDFLMLERASIGSTGFFLMVPTFRPASSGNVDQLLIVFRGDQRFVSSMELPQYGVGLDFSVPGETVNAGKSLAQVRAGTSPRIE